MPLSQIFNKQITLAVGQNQLSALLLAAGYDGSLALSQLKVIDLAGDTVVIFTDDATTPGFTTGETVGAAGVSKSATYDGTSVPIPATNVWLYQAAAHAVTISVISY